MIVNRLPDKISFFPDVFGRQPMPPTSVFYYLLCIATAASLTLVAAVMAWRKLYWELPFFFSYVAFHICGSGVAWYLYFCGTYAQYFWAYYTVRVMYAILGFLVVREVLQSVFRGYKSLEKIGLTLFQWIALVLVAVAVVTAAAAPGIDVGRITAVILVGQRSVLVIQAGLLLLLLLLSLFFAFSWKTYVFGVATGFGVLASVQLIALSLRTEQGSAAAANTFRLMLEAAETCAALIWVAYFLAPARKQVRENLPKAKLEDWNRTLLELLHR